MDTDVIFALIVRHSSTLHLKTNVHFNSGHFTAGHKGISVLQLGPHKVPVPLKDAGVGLKKQNNSV